MINVFGYMCVLFVVVEFVVVVVVVVVTDHTAVVINDYLELLLPQ